MSHWLPIETAPKDGTYIFAVSLIGPYDEYAVVHWIDLSVDPGTDNGAAYWKEDHTMCAFPAKYWMPIPPLPKPRHGAIE